MFQYRRTTNASRRAERKIKYLHVSAQVITIPTGQNTSTQVLSTKAYFPNEFPVIHRGNTLSQGRNKIKVSGKSAKRIEKRNRRIARNVGLSGVGVSQH